jgi:hypothetical protein
MYARLLLTLGALVLVACSAGDEPAGGAGPEAMTQGARDSAVARSGLPGARAVGRAQDAAGAAQERAARMDSLQQQP